MEFQQEKYEESKKINKLKKYSYLPEYEKNNVFNKNKSNSIFFFNKLLSYQITSNPSRPNGPNSIWAECLVLTKKGTEKKG